MSTATVKRGANRGIKYRYAARGGCISCGVLFAWFNNLFDKPEDCGRCHRRKCRATKCARCKVIASTWREHGWP